MAAVRPGRPGQAERLARYRSAARPYPCAVRALARSAADGRSVMRSMGSLARTGSWGRLVSRHAILRGTPARSFTGCASRRTPFRFAGRGRREGLLQPTRRHRRRLRRRPLTYTFAHGRSFGIPGPSRSAVGGGRSHPGRAVVPASPSCRGPKRSILSGTASEDRLAPTARSADITWSRGADEVFGAHGCKASASGSATWSRPSRSGRSCVPPGSAPRQARPRAWKQVLAAPVGGIPAVDFVHADTVPLLRRLHGLIIIEL
jgi:hypothetical protein